LGILNLQHKTNQFNLWFGFVMIWIVIGFGLDRQSILKNGFRFGWSITMEKWKNWIEQQPAYKQLSPDLIQI